MKNAYLLILTTLIATVAASETVLGEDPFDCESQTSTIFTGDIDHDWTIPGNWTNGAPNKSKDACIPPDEKAQIIFDDDEEVRKLWIQADPPYIGTLELIGNDKLVPFKLCSLAVYGDVWIDGELLMTSAPKLRIWGDRTFKGKGKLILWAEFTNTYPKILEHKPPSEPPDPPPPDSSLTLEGDGCWDDDQDPGEEWICGPEDWEGPSGGLPENTLVLMGGGLIDVELTNNAHVTTWTHEQLSWLNIADTSLTITKASDGNGFWIAERNTELTYDTAIVDVRETVTGAGTWVVASGDACVGGTNPGDPCDDDSDCTVYGTCERAGIWINEACTDLTGAVIIGGGELKLYENFTASGKLDMTGGEIWLESGNLVANFGQ